MSNWDEPIELDEDIELWEQQPGESDEQFTLFKMYEKLTPEADTETREVMPRRLSELFDKTQFSSRHVKRLAKRFCWEVRARAHDLAKTQSVQGQLEHHWLVLVENRLRQLSKAEELIFKALVSMTDDAEAWRPRDLIMFWETSMKAGNGILGMTTRGGPDQNAVAYAGARADVTIGTADSLDARTIELAEELRRRAAVAAAEQPEAIEP